LVERLERAKIKFIIFQKLKKYFHAFHMHMCLSFLHQAAIPKTVAKNRKLSMEYYSYILLQTFYEEFKIPH
jgi:hypothetical protein